MIEKIMWYYNCTREYAESLIDDLSDRMLEIIDMTHRTWVHGMDIDSTEF